MTMDLTSNEELTQQLLKLGILNWNDVLLHVKNIPYGRNSNREDLSLVLKENKGSCSSKHAFLKEIANQNNIPNVQLIIGIYKMNESNTKIGTILSENSIDYVPEAHCYLNINGERLDYTTGSSSFEKLKNDILEEIEIEPYQVGEFKIEYHQNFMKKWLIDTKSNLSFSEIWCIREKCIAYLSL
jgi:hypothetical protein